MSESLQKKQVSVKNDITVQYLSVDPKLAGWSAKYYFRKNFTRRVFLQNSSGGKTGLQMSLLMGVMNEALGEDSSDYLLIDAETDMTDYWNKSKHDEDAFQRGNSLYLTDDGWSVVSRLMSDGDYDDHAYTFSQVTIVEKRNDV